MKPVTLMLVATLLGVGCISVNTTRTGGRPTPAPRGYYAVSDFGAKGDGTTDDTAAIQAALDKAGETGGVVALPVGRFLVKGTLNIPEDVALEGTWRAPARTKDSKGSTLLVTAGKGDADETPFLTLNTCSTLKGVEIFYPEQIDANPPIPYPWTVVGIGDNCTIKDVLMVNPYQAVDFGSNHCGRHYINGLYAQALYRGIYIDRCYDVGRIENVHLWPFWTEGPVVQFSREQGTAFLFGRTDWQFVTNCFCISYQTGFLFKDFGSGPGNVLVTQSGSDIGERAVYVEAVQTHAGVSFTNCQFMACAEVAPTNTGPVKFTASGFWPIDTTGTQAKLHGTGAVLFEGCHFAGWDKQGKGAAAIEDNAERLTVQGCDFMQNTSPQIHLGPKVKSAVISSSTLRGGARIVNDSKGKVVTAANVE